jgi:hypothetical protein
VEVQLGRQELALECDNGMFLLEDSLLENIYLALSLIILQASIAGTPKSYLQLSRGNSRAARERNVCMGRFEIREGQ